VDSGTDAALRAENRKLAAENLRLQAEVGELRALLLLRDKATADVMVLGLAGAGEQGRGEEPAIVVKREQAQVREGACRPGHEGCG
jgi:hypothetical protein